MDRETAKLKTEVVDGKLHVDDSYPLRYMVPDALYVYVLVQAMHDALDVTYCGPSTREGTMQWIVPRADELMRE